MLSFVLEIERTEGYAIRRIQTNKEDFNTIVTNTAAAGK